MSLCSQIRASRDYFASLSTQWKIGLSTMLFHAIGVASSKDNAWSAVDEPGTYKDSRREPRFRLESAVLALSGGPVAFGDKIGLENKTIIMATCRADGIILKPDKPATLIDTILSNRVYNLQT